MISPCNMKTRRMVRAEAPIVLRIAMSRLRSITSMTSEAMMCRAATTTMRPTAIEIPIFSSHIAPNSGAFSRDQSSAT